jgi:C4-dicarboxylate transporter DctM subunit
LVAFFKALVGWMPGGIAVLVAGVCAVFTTFTGGSGVTIIALGGLAFGMLQKGGYPQGFALGHVTASSSLGLLFPPSLPVILYAVVVSGGPMAAMGVDGSASASVAADDLYIAGLLPGLLMAMMVAGYGLWVGRRVETERLPFNGPALLKATWGAKWELSVPVLVIGLFASGFLSMVEAAAFAALYALVIQVFVTKDIHFTRELPGVLARTGVLVGAVLILLASAMGLSAFCLVEAEVPDILLEWCKANIDSKIMFLLLLNGLLLVLGSVLEIYSALVILPPIIAPIALQFGVDPVHLGVIFLANLELGFLTPPVGLNLFLSSVRFEQPITRIYREIIPYLIILLISVMIITYVPAISTGFLSLFR